MNEVLVRPLITEKMTNISADFGKYGFLVNPKANKIEIKKAIEKKFEVHVIKSQFRKSGKFEGKTPKFKKAIVTLKEGEKIELFEQV
jgi:large subunit ribosomal protein L23